MAIAASEDEDFVAYEDGEIEAYEDEDSGAFDTEIAASDEAIEPCKVNEEPDADEDTPYEDAEPCVEIAAYDEETVASGDKEIVASEGMEIEQLEVTVRAEDEPELELEDVESFEVTEPLVVIAELVVVKPGVTEQSSKVELPLKLQSWLVVHPSWILQPLQPVE
ncbi:uncharacterized protein BKA55DRAFT_694156 [Fusarium redolens]|jgi:hypothetical protein|uniref:Uncharacterized protein n=1 Tax=Fusarium redolens TaxID=48865 RepID=A0A9P9GGP8_FUSRE|nr:uncharacterized protein BKA55DRAFT_694156 [Fusarium redolens]KAH7237669.1 hypothetical protein BKA55DRAFT_694156 [Fusarium redolens]